MPESEWPFADPPDTACFTTTHVLDGSHEIHHVTHHAEDGAWNFLPPLIWEDSTMRVVGLSTIAELDETVLEVADLPFGWRASRARRGASWVRTINPETRDS